MPLSPSSSKPNRFIEELLNDGEWKQTGKPKIIKLGNTIILGKRNTLDFVTVEGKKTGWRMYEYERILEAPLFQHMVVVHIFYKLQLDQTADFMGDVYEEDWYSVDDGEVEEMIKDGWELLDLFVKKEEGRIILLTNWYNDVWLIEEWSLFPPSPQVAKTMYVWGGGIERP